MSIILSIRAISNALCSYDRAQLRKKEAIVKLKAQARVTTERSHIHPVLEIWATLTQLIVIVQQTSKTVMVRSATIGQQVPYRLRLSRFEAY
jgi:hypothetical protein